MVRLRILVGGSMSLIVLPAGRVQTVMLVVLAGSGPFGQILLCSTCILAVDRRRIALAIGVVLALVPHMVPVGLVGRGPPGCSQPLRNGTCQREEGSTTSPYGGMLPIVRKLALPLPQLFAATHACVGCAFATHGADQARSTSLMASAYDAGS